MYAVAYNLHQMTLKQTQIRLCENKEVLGALWEYHQAALELMKHDWAVGKPHLSES